MCQYVWTCSIIRTYCRGCEIGNHLEVILSTTPVKCKAKKDFRRYLVNLFTDAAMVSLRGRIRNIGRFWLQDYLFLCGFCLLSGVESIARLGLVRRYLPRHSLLIIHRLLIFRSEPKKDNKTFSIDFCSAYMKHPRLFIASCCLEDNLFYIYPCSSVSGIHSCYFRRTHTRTIERTF